MSNVVFTTELVDRIGLLGDVMASFLEEQVNAIQKRLAEQHPNVDENAAWKTISTFSTLEGTKIPMTKDEIQAQLPYSNGQIDLMLGLFEKARILRLADGIYEIAHDTLALQVSEKRSGEEKALLEIQKLVDDRYGAYIQTGALMSKKELDYIATYESKLPTTVAQKSFIKKSKRSVKRRRAILIGALVTAFSIISIFAVIAVIQQRAAKKAETEAIAFAQEAVTERKKAEAEKIKADEARKEAEEAKEEAIEQRQIALASREEAIAQRQIAETSKEKAIKAREEADEQRKKAEGSEEKAVAALKKAVEQERIAKEQEALALQKEAEAIKQEKIAKEQEQLAKKLRIRSLSSALSVKSASMKYQDRIKGLLAMEAYSLQKSTNDQLSPPEIYSGLYSAVNKYMGENFDEIEDSHNGAIRSLLSAKGNVIYSASSDGRLSKWAFSDFKDVGKPAFQKSTIKNVATVDIKAAISKNKKWLAIGGKSSTIELINLQNNETKFITMHRGKDIYDLVFTPDNNKLISVGADKTVQQYNLENQQSSILIAPLASISEAITVSPNGKYLDVGIKSGHLLLYDFENLNTPIFNVALGSNITKLAFDKSTKMLVAGLENGTLYTFSEKDGSYDKNRSHFRKNHAQRISDIKFRTYTNTDKVVTNVMAVGSYDGTITVWTMSGFAKELYEPLVFDNDQKWVMSIEFLNRGTQLVAGYLDGKMKFWALSTSKVADKLCSLLTQKYSSNKQLSNSEFKQYLGDGIDRNDYPDYCK